MNAVQTPARPLPGEVRITGTLVDDAVMRVSTGAAPHAVLCMLVQAPGGLPWLIRHDCGTAASEHIAAAAKARAMRRGALVRVYASGAIPRLDHDTAALRLEGVTDVQLVSPPARAGEAHHPDAAATRQEA